MKQTVLFSFVFLLAGCSSMQPKVEELEAAQTCNVWKEDGLGIRHAVEVEGELAKQKMTCWVMNMFACTYNKYTFASPDSGTIHSSILGDVGTLKGKTMSAHITGATVDPFEIKDGVADYNIKGPIGPKKAAKVEFNEKCSTRQAALGLMALIGI